jgi:hypothetical protein
MKKLCLLVLLTTASLFATPPEKEKGLLVVDFESASASKIMGTDVTKLQDPDFPEQVKALKYRDQIIFKTAEGIFTGTVGVAYRDVNMVEVRAGYFQPRNNGYREIFHFTYDQDALVGWMEYTYAAKEYNILYTKASGKLTAYSEESRMKHFRCGNEDGAALSELSEEQKAEIHANFSAPQPATFYTNIWEVPEYVTQNYLICYTKDAYEYSKRKGGINHLMAHGIVHGTLLLSNSNIKACLRLGHSQLLADYPDNHNSGKSLGDFNGYKNGCQDAYDMRCRYGCDMGSIGIKHATYTGLANVNFSQTGSESIPFNCMDSDFLGGTGWCHEDGHTMGGRHYIDTYAENNRNSLFDHSFGCHNTPPGAPREYGSVMARSAGLFNYYSSTNIYYDGVPISTNAKCRVADTWTKIRRYAARYRCNPVIPDVDGLICNEEFEYPDGMGLMWQEGGEGFCTPWEHCNTNIFQTVSDTMERPGFHRGGVLRINNVNAGSESVRRFIFWGRNINGDYHYSRTNFWLRSTLNIKNENLFYIYLGSLPIRFGDGRIRIINGNTGLTYEYDKTFSVLVHFEMGPQDTTVSIWKDYEGESAPDPSSAAFTLEVNNTTYFGNYRYLTLYSMNNFQGELDDLRMGFTYESLDPPERPMGFTIVPGGYTNDYIRMVWRNVTEPESFEILRSTVNDLDTAVSIATLEGGTAGYKDTHVDGGVTYYYWLKANYSDHVFTTLVRKGIAGIPVDTVEANGEYTIGQGQVAHLTAKGTTGYLPMIRWTVGDFDTVFLTNHYDYAFNERIIMTPGDYPVKIEVTEQEVQTDILEDTTVLHVTNSYPHVTFELQTEDPMAGKPLIFRAYPTDPGTNDILTVRWRFSSDAEWTPFTNSYYAAHVFPEEGRYTVECEVMDNYGATTVTSKEFVFGAASAIPVIPAALAMDNGHSAVLLLSNDGSAPYDFVIDTTSRMLTAYPSSGTVPGEAGGVTPVLIKLQHQTTGGTAGNYTIKVITGEDIHSVTLRVPYSECQLSIQSPEAVKNKDYTLFSALGSQDDYNYRWLVDGEDVSGILRGLLWRGTLVRTPGDHSLVLQALKDDETVVKTVTNSLYIASRDPEVYLEEVKREGLSVTYRPVVIVNGREEANVRYNWDDGNGWTVWQEPKEISHTFAKGRTYLVQCQVRVGQQNNATSTKFDPETALTLSASFGNGEKDFSCQVGETVTMNIASFSGAGSVWREAISNPELELIADASAQSVEVTPTVPGEYVFLAYTQNDDAIGAPEVLILNVEEDFADIAHGSVAGVIVTNTVYGSGVCADCVVRVTGKDFELSVSNRFDGSFILEGLPMGPLTLNVSGDILKGRIVEIALTNGATTLNVPVEIADANTIFYAQLNDKRSNLPIQGADVRAGSKLGTTTNKGRSTALTMPEGEYVLVCDVPYRGLIITNVYPVGNSKTYNLLSDGYSPYIHGFLYGTGGETVKQGVIQVLSTLTMNIVQRYAVSGVPYYSIGLIDGHEVTLRYRLEDYDNENFTFTPEGCLDRDVVLTPEPGIAALLALLLFLTGRKRG